MKGGECHGSNHNDPMSSVRRMPGGGDIAGRRQNWRGGQHGPAEPCRVEPSHRVGPQR